MSDIVERLRDWASNSTGRNPANAPCADAADEIERLRAMVDALLDHCPDGECEECSRIACPHNDVLHLHHDGCPSCYIAEKEK